MHRNISVGVELQGRVLRVASGPFPEVDSLALESSAPSALEELGMVEELAETTLSLLETDRALLAPAEEIGGVGGLQ